MAMLSVPVPCCGLVAWTPTGPVRALSVSLDQPTPKGNVRSRYYVAELDTETGLSGSFRVEMGSEDEARNVKYLREIGAGLLSLDNLHHKDPASQPAGFLFRAMLNVSMDHVNRDRIVTATFGFDSVGAITRFDTFEQAERAGYYESALLPLGKSLTTAGWAHAFTNHRMGVEYASWLRAIKRNDVIDARVPGLSSQFLQLVDQLTEVPLLPED